MSVKKLKVILEERGVSYMGLVEKKEFVELVEVCGVVIGVESCFISIESFGEDEEKSNEL